MDTEKFLDFYGTRNGRWLANRLGLAGKGSEGLANALSSYAWNMRAANALRGIQEMKGHDTKKNEYFRVCLIIKEEIKAHPLFPMVSRKIAFW